MIATLTGLNYEIHLQEPRYDLNLLKVKVYKMNRRTFIVDPTPVISINTTVDAFAQALRDHYGQSPFKRQKG